jgi:hypothetical protein
VYVVWPRKVRGVHIIGQLNAGLASSRSQSFDRSSANSTQGPSVTAGRVPQPDGARDRGIPIVSFAE